MQTPLYAVSATAFDKAMDKLWQDFVQGSPIGGGMMFESQVRSCTLDDSMESLKQLDRLLLAVKKQFAQTDADENDLLKRADFRHFALFLAGYVGRVLAKASGSPISWRNLDELTALHRLDVSAGKFFTAMAVTFVDKPLPPMFVLVVIGAKLFGSFERPFKDPVSHELANESLYRLASICLERAGVAIPQIAKAPQIQPLPKESLAPTSSPVAMDKPAHIVQPAQTAPQPTLEPVLAKPLDLPSSNAPMPSTQPMTSTVMPQVAPSNPAPQTPSQVTLQATPQVAPTPSPIKPAITSSKKTNPPVKKDELNEVKQDLINLPAIATPHDEHYQKAKAMLDKITANISQNGQTLDTLTDDYKRAIAQAVGVLEKVANAGNTNAMLLLAIVHYDGILLANNPTAVFDWTKKSADANDIRGQKLLSRLYYQGIGTNPSVATGQFWLEKSATGGHPEAKKLQNQLEMIAMMKEDQHAEKQKDKKLYMVLGATGVALIVALWLLAKFAG